MAGFDFPFGDALKFVGGIMDRNQQKDFNQQQQYQAALNRRDQYEFAQSGIQWKVADALKAGVHPIFGLGGQTSSFSPISVGGSPVSGMGDALGSMGQGISRAVLSAQDKEVKQQAEGLALEKAGLENELLRSQIRSNNQQSAPGIPAPGKQWMLGGQGDSPALNPVPYVSGGAAPWAGPPSVVNAQKYPAAKQNVQLGKIWESNPYVSSASDVQDRHGELMESLWGLVTTPADIGWNLKKNLGVRKLMRDLQEWQAKRKLTGVRTN